MDPYELALADEGTVAQKAAAMAAALRRDQALGQVLQLTGHRAVAPLGASIAKGAQDQVEQMPGIIERRPGMALQRAQLAKMQAETEAIPQRRTTLTKALALANPAVGQLAEGADLGTVEKLLPFAEHLSAQDARRDEARLRREQHAEDLRLRKEAQGEAKADRLAREERAKQERIDKEKAKVHPVPQSTLDDIKGSQEALLALDTLDQKLNTENLGAGGAISGVLTRGLGGIGLASIPGTDANAARPYSMSAAQSVGRVAEGGKLGEGDIARYRQMIPGEGDAPKARGPKFGASYAQTLSKLEAAIATFPPGMENDPRLQAALRTRGELLKRVAKFGAGKPAAAQAAAAPVKISSDAEYEALPKGTAYIAPDGSQRVKR